MLHTENWAQIWVLDDLPTEDEHLVRPVDQAVVVALVPPAPVNHFHVDVVGALQRAPADDVEAAVLTARHITESGTASGAETGHQQVLCVFVCTVAEQLRTFSQSKAVDLPRVVNFLLTGSFPIGNFCSGCTQMSPTSFHCMPSYC